MKELRINYKSIRLGSFLYLAFPVVLFFIGFVKWNITLPAILFIGWIVFKLGREKEAPRYVTFKINTLFIVIVAFILWAYLGGQGGLFYQTSDWNERNAIFRDLIQFDWPVYYPKTDTMLTYYIGHWLPAAGMGKIIYILSSNRVLAFQIGNLFLALWTIIGILFTYLFRNSTRREDTIFMVLLKARYPIKKLTITRPGSLCLTITGIKYIISLSSNTAIQRP